MIVYGLTIFNSRIFKILSRCNNNNTNKNLNTLQSQLDNFLKTKKNGIYLKIFSPSPRSYDI